MEQLVQEYPSHIREMAARVTENPLPARESSFKNILIAGMGGSAMGGTLMAGWADRSGSMPVHIVRGYRIPEWVTEETLVIASSYSGNTEETLTVFGQAAKRQATVMALCGGGHLLEMADEMGFIHVQMPSEIPAPRAALAHSTVALTHILEWAGAMPAGSVDKMLQAASLLEQYGDEIKTKAAQIAPLLYGKIPAIYVAEGMEAVAIRWRQQINENAKRLAWHHVVPEMNHNELVGWRDDYHGVAAVFLKSRHEHPRNLARFALTREVVSEFTDTVVEVFAKGEGYMERVQYLIHLGDWVSVFLARESGRDVMEVSVIDFLKGALKELQEDRG